MGLLIFLISFYYINIIFAIELYYDLKFRKVSNKLFKYAFKCSFVLIILEFILSPNSIFEFLVVKFFFLYLLFFLHSYYII